MSAHLAYVAASYAAALLVIAGLVVWVVLDARARHRELKALEEAGIRRRSQGGGTV
ncbi:MULTISPECIES: heme exporter protein CcmD [unclassified Rhizobium]|uniref:heme exporter protein CcmD n=1 Tax=unclassified Rhizobium TaxID=2613769 RepID=UPI0009E8072E|nr:MULTISPECIES: heme exporter protein CcmD [unclassified Rhizobium]